MKLKDAKGMLQGVAIANSWKFEFTEDKITISKPYGTTAVFYPLWDGFIGVVVTVIDQNYHTERTVCQNRYENMSDLVADIENGVIL